MSTLNIVGHRFFYLTVVEKAPSVNRRSYWDCICDCGNKVIIRQDALIKRQKSCGCLKNSQTSLRLRRHGKSFSREYRSWLQMKSRCTNPNSSNFKNYGLRGISFCSQWDKFDNFYKDMGDASVGMSLDRIDVNGNYEPSNCRWANMKTQQNNKRNNRIIEFNGTKMTLMQWADETGILRTTIDERLKRGWSTENALHQGTKWHRSTKK